MLPELDVSPDPISLIRREEPKPTPILNPDTSIDPGEINDYEWGDACSGLGD